MHSGSLTNGNFPRPKQRFGHSNLRPDLLTSSRGQCVLMFPGGADTISVRWSHWSSGRSHRVQERSHHPAAAAAEGLSEHAFPVGDEPHGQTQLPVRLRDAGPAVQVLRQGAPKSSVTSCLWAGWHWLGWHVTFCGRLPTSHYRLERVCILVPPLLRD